MAMQTNEKRVKKLSNFFGILSEEEGHGMLDDIERIRRIDVKLLKKELN